jgi:hypothetical protein
MSCPDWPHLVAHRDQDSEGELLWGRALTHLDDCGLCRAAAYAAEPALVFRRLPALPTTSADLVAMKQAVGALRRARPMVEPGARARRRSTLSASSVRLRAAAMVAVVAGAALLWGVLGREATGPGTVEPRRGLPEELLTTAEAPTDDLRFEIRVLRASKHALAGPGLAESDLPPELVEELNSVIRYEHYQVVAQAVVDAALGEVTSSALGDGFDVSLKAGAVEGGKRVLVEDFTIEKKAIVKGRQDGGAKPVLRAPLELELDEPFTLFVGNLNDEDLLVVAVTCRRSAAR